MRDVEWHVFRWLLVASCLLLEIRILIPDFPWGTRLFVVLTMDPNGWLHEAFYVATAFLVLIDITYHWEMKSKKSVFVIRTKEQH